MSKKENHKVEVNVVLDLVDFVNDDTLIFSESTSYRPHLKGKKIFSIKILEEQILKHIDFGVTSFQLEENIEEWIEDKLGEEYDLISYDTTKILDYAIENASATIELKIEADIIVKKKEKELKNGNKAKV